jgi:hypothetical protein
MLLACFGTAAALVWVAALFCVLAPLLSLCGRHVGAWTLAVVQTDLSELLPRFFACLFWRARAARYQLMLLPTSRCRYALAIAPVQEAGSQS